MVSGATVAVEIRVRGRVQGVGLRPAVWRLGRQLGLRGEVLNDGEGVLVRAGGNAAAVEALVTTLRRDPPPLARIERIETRAFAGDLADGFRIVASEAGPSRTQIAPDAAMCAACAAETLDPFARRYRYPFTNCTDCGPRLSIVRAVPYDRATTTMAPFAMCPACRAEYEDPADRRFHAEAIACHACGPAARLIRFDGRAISFDQHSMLDDVDAVCSLLQKGEIVAIKGLGGYQLACDATNAAAVARLRVRKRRAAKPFALMARDLDGIARFATGGAGAGAGRTSAKAPIVLLPADGPERLPEAVAPGLRTLGFMLPTTPLHQLMLRRMARPLVMTSGNLAEEPQATEDSDARQRLAPIADYALVHDREITNRIDDSVVRVMAGRARVLRRARGWAPEPIPLPEGFAHAPDVLALGGELKATFCLVKDGAAVLSQHQGDLEDAAAFDDYCRNLDLYRRFLDHRSMAVAIDRHPEYLSAKLGRERAAADGLPLLAIQHHHAHIAACLVENRYPLTAPPVLGIVLDGLGMGDDGALWGGEFLLADYRGFQRLGTFKPVAVPGGAQAPRAPGRNLYAHLAAEMSWAELTMNFAELEVYDYLAAKPLPTLDAMIRAGVNAPPASSCGRLFDAAAAALGLCRERQAYEGEAAARLEAIVDQPALAESDDSLAYPFAIPRLRGVGLPYVEPLAMWRALLGDLILRTPASVIAARFHQGLARAIAAMASEVTRDGSIRTAVLSGGCFNNRVLLEECVRRLGAVGFTVLTHAEVPAGDGGLALGQAAVAAASLIEQGDGSCA